MSQTADRLLLSMVFVVGVAAGCVELAGLNTDRTVAPPTDGGRDATTPSRMEASVADTGGTLVPTPTDSTDAAAEADAADSCNGPGLVRDPSTKHCYRLFLAELNWADAEASCVQWGGHLTAITSEAEWNVIAKGFDSPTTPAALWIGGTDVVTDGVYQWTTGEPFNTWVPKPPWNQGKPDGTTNENCIEMEPSTTWLWNDKRCNSPLPYICEK